MFTIVTWYSLISLFVFDFRYSVQTLFSFRSSKKFVSFVRTMTYSVWESYRNKITISSFRIRLRQKYLRLPLLRTRTDGWRLRIKDPIDACWLVIINSIWRGFSGFESCLVKFCKESNGCSNIIGSKMMGLYYRWRNLRTSYLFFSFANQNFVVLERDLRLLDTFCPLIYKWYGIKCEKL